MPDTQKTSVNRHPNNILHPYALSDVLMMLEGRSISYVLRI